MKHRSKAEIEADLVAARAARSALIAGERVREVWRDGRRLIFEGIKLFDVESMIASLEREYEAACNAAAGRPRRRPIALAWRN